jgi:predicted SprT family Zn-dependent metalloprotease
MKLPKSPITGSVEIQTTSDGITKSRKTKNSIYICRNCGKDISLKRKSIHSFWYECSHCNFKEDVDLR